MVLERINSRQLCSFCGLLPEIGRAWASVDNALFLWRYDTEYDTDAASLRPAAAAGVRVLASALGLTPSFATQ